MSKFSCPNCGSENTASVPLVYKRGHATGTATHKEIVGYNVEVEKITYADGSTEEKNTGRSSPIYGDVTRPTYTETDLARELEPPTEPTVPEYKNISIEDTLGCGCGLLVLSVVLVISFGSGFGLDFTTGCKLIAVLFTILLVLYIVYNKRDNEKNYKEQVAKFAEEYPKYQEKLEIWQRQYICMRCGHKFYIE